MLLLFYFIETFYTTFFKHKSKFFALIVKKKARIVHWNVKNKKYIKLTINLHFEYLIL